MYTEIKVPFNNQGIHYFGYRHMIIVTMPLINCHDQGMVDSKRADKLSYYTFFY
jgi:hypothetical protein